MLEQYLYFIGIVTQTSNGIDWSLCRLSHQMRLLNSAMGLTTHKTCIYLSAAKSSFLFFPLPFFSVRPVVVCGVYLFKAHISLQFYPRSTCSTPFTLVKEKKKKSVSRWFTVLLFCCTRCQEVGTSRTFLNFEAEVKAPETLFGCGVCTRWERMSSCLNLSLALIPSVCQ